MEGTTILMVIVLAMIVEALVDTIKWVYEKGYIQIDRVVALVVSILIMVLAKIDLFAMINVNLTIPYVGSVLTGILAARGSNVLHDIWVKISEIAGTRPTMAK